MPVSRAVWMWASWALVAAYGAWMAWHEIWPQAAGLLQRAMARSAFAPSPDAAERGLLLTAAGWLVGWVALCTLWAALLLWSSRLIWAGAPLARALFG